MNIKNIHTILSDKFGELIKYSEEKDIIYTPASDWSAIALEIKNNQDLTFDYLMCITGYDNGVGNDLGAAYNFYSTFKKHYLEIRIEVDREEPVIPSVEKLWRTADWLEREIFDLYGIDFKDHWDLRRILLPADWEGYPLRKDYKEPNYYNGMPVPKDKSYWE